MKNKHTPDVFFNLFRFSIATIVFFSTANFANFANKRIRFAHSLTSSRVSFSFSLMRKPAISVRIFCRIFSMDFERSDPNQRKPSLIFSRILSMDFQKDFGKISIKINTENLSENISTILSLGRAKPSKSQLKIYLIIPTKN